MRQTFNTHKEAVAWEDTVLRRINAVKNEKWLNAGRGGKEFIAPSGPSHYAYGKPEINSNYGKPVSEERKMKQSQTMSGRKNGIDFFREDYSVSEETRMKLREFNIGNNHRKGKKNSEYHNQRLRECNLGPNNPNFNKKVYHNGFEEHFFGEDEIVLSGYVLGRLPFSNKKKDAMRNSKQGKRVYNNGQVAKYFLPDNIPTGFTLGRLSR